MNCHLLIPGLLPPPQWIGSGLLQGLHLPALETLFARAQKSPPSAGGKDAWLCQTFGVEQQDDWPAAPFSLLAEDGNPGSDFWLIAEPVQLQLQRNRMVLANSGNLAISIEEAASFMAALNDHFADDGLTFLSVRPDRWYLRLAHPARLETYPPDAAIGRDVRRFLPGGADGKYWQGILNEIQMLLHDHPVNVKREQRGVLPVNSIWPWGAGSLPQNMNSPYTQVWSGDALTRGLAIAAGTAVSHSPTAAAEWLHQAAPGNHLIELGKLRSAALYGDFPRWCESLMLLEKDWISPLLQALARGNITGLTLPVFGVGQANIFSIRRTDLWKIWRRGKPLHHFFEEYAS